MLLAVRVEQKTLDDRRFADATAAQDNQANVVADFAHDNGNAGDVWRSLNAIHCLKEHTPLKRAFAPIGCTAETRD